MAKKSSPAPASKSKTQIKTPAKASPKPPPPPPAPPKVKQPPPPKVSPAKPKRTPKTEPKVKAKAPAPAPAAQVMAVAAPAPDPDPLNILFVTSEARPFAKTGGLADVCGALPQALARLGHKVTVVLPKYRGTQTDGTPGWAANIPFGANVYPVHFVEQTLEPGVTAVLIDAPDLYDRPGIYGEDGGEYLDNAFRFAVLCRGALEYTRLKGVRPSAIHAHDWQGALAPVYARTVLKDDPFVGGVKTVLTIHNLAFQGCFDQKELQWIDLGLDLYNLNVLEFWGRASALKGGVVLSDVITTVSPTYAREILEPEGGFGFNGILKSRANSLVGILNGIDTDVWNPETDPHLPVRFGPSSLDAKRTVKRALLEAAGLPSDEAALHRPLIGIVSRLTHQKGCDLYAGAAELLMRFDASWVVLGSGDSWCEDIWTRLAVNHPDRVATTIGFDDRLAHLIEGGADMFLMPSWYEPCGLNQMYSQRYGTLPIVRAVGGLQDTVVDPDESMDRATGFKFLDYTPDALLWVLGRAVGMFGNPQSWQGFQQNAMRQDFSWDVSAREYVKVYRGF